MNRKGMITEEIVVGTPNKSKTSGRRCNQLVLTCVKDVGNVRIIYDNTQIEETLVIEYTKTHVHILENVDTINEPTETHKHKPENANF